MFTSAILPQGLEVLEVSRRVDTDGRWVTVEVAWNEKWYTLVSIYAPAAQDERIMTCGDVITP